MNRLKNEQIELVLALLLEGVSISGASRVTYVSETAIGNVLDKAGTACKLFHDEHVRNLDLSYVQCDEMWSYVYAKSRRVGEAKAAPAGAGDAWIWTALDRDTKLLAAYHIGSRETLDALKLTRDLADRINSRLQVTTDQHKPYLDALELAFGSRIDYAQIGKGVDEESNERVRRIISGSPQPEMVSTSHVERMNLTLRMHSRRLIRQTNGFSKKLPRHEAMMNLFAVYYNFCRVHLTIRKTPAMAAGLDTIVRNRRWMAQMVLDMYDPPKPRGPYRKTKRRGIARRAAKTRGRARAIREELQCPNPKCGSHWLPKKGKGENKQFYRCGDCGHSFSVLQGETRKRIE